MGRLRAGQMFEKIFYGTGFGRERMSAARAGYLFLIWALIPASSWRCSCGWVVGMAFTGALASLVAAHRCRHQLPQALLHLDRRRGLEDLTIRPNHPDRMARHHDDPPIRIDLPNLGVMQQALAAASGDDDSEAGYCAWSTGSTTSACTSRA
jgi:hypothetical protein